MTMIQPPSPTLSNPSMILPDYGDYDYSSSPPKRSYSTEDPWSSSSRLNRDFALGLPEHGAIGSLGALGPLTPTTPIIYGNGTMLSDIGEVTEAESLPPKKLPGPAERRAWKQQQAQSTPYRASPTMGYDAVLKRTKRGTHERKISVESTSTITSEPQAAEFEDVEDSVSVDDSVFQGDDEQSVADSYTEGVIASETQRLAGNAHGDVEDKNSSAALSRRAEQILQTAKKRLNTMEGNLTRARSSLYTTPTSSMSSIHSSSPLSRSTPSPPPYSELRKQYKSMQALSETKSASPGHGRTSSDHSISSPSAAGPLPARSASAAATYSRTGLNGSPPDAKTSSARAHSSPYGRPSPPHGAILEPLSEDEAPDFAKNEPGVRTSFENCYPSLFIESRNLTRSTSSMQMRDLRDQMHDLKGRLSVLRDRARDDTLKRRSLQSLRTPSPFTAADSWTLPISNGHQDGTRKADSSVLPHPLTEGVLGQSEQASEEEAEQVGKQVPEDATSEITSIYEDVNEMPHTEQPSHETIPEEEEEDSFEHVEEEVEAALDENFEDEIGNDNYHEEGSDYDSDATQYHDSVVSHEDREDAFDYEHFFLHSAMGTINQQRLARRGSNGSFSSEDSVETTRGPTVSNANTANNANSLERPPPLGHLRSESAASISTINTFATADEGHRSPTQGDEHDENAVQKGSKSVQNHHFIPEATEPSNKRSTFGSSDLSSLPENYASPATPDGHPISVVRILDNNDLHRPSIASFDSATSIGTTRSFPLVNKPKSQNSTRTGTPEPANRESRRGSVIKLSENGNVVGHGEVKDGKERKQPSPVNMLAMEDRVLVERVVASVGKCVLGLQEAGDKEYEKRVWRRRLDAARRVLEGVEGAV